MTSVIKTPVILLFSVLLIGCVSNPHTVKGTVVSVIPVDYQYRIDIKDQKQSREDIQAFIDVNRTALLSQPVHLGWTGKKGKSEALFVQKWLLNQGAISGNITLAEIQVAKQTSNSIEIQTSKYEVKTPDCGYVEIEQFGMRTDGCTVSSMRWQSMVYPQKLLIAPIYDVKDLKSEHME